MGLEAFLVVLCFASYRCVDSRIDLLVLEAGLE